MTSNHASSPTLPHPPAHLTLDTTAGSILHKLPRALARFGGSGALSSPMLYVGAVSLTLLPLVLVGWLTGPASSCEQRMSLLCDFSVLFLFALTFPIFLLLTVSDNEVLRQALYTVQIDGTVTISKPDAEALAKTWHHRFRKINVLALCAGIIAALITAFVFIWGVTTKPDRGGWFAHQGHIQPVGYVFLYCIVLLASVSAIYVFRSIAVGVLLRDIATKAELHMLPLHPDKAGGLQPIGHLGLRNQYGLTIVGFNIVLAVLEYLFVPNSHLMIEIIAAAVIAYIIFGPVVFVAPLLPFRACMVKTKAKLMTGVALRMREQLESIRDRLKLGTVTMDDEQAVERLRKIGSVIDDLPVWPFDAVTLRKFFTAYVIPLLGIAVPVAQVILKYFQESWLSQLHV